MSNHEITKKTVNILFRITDIIALCFLVPLFVCSLFAYRTIDFETMRETTSEAFSNPAVSFFFALLLVGVLWLIIRWMRILDDRKRRIASYAVTAVCIACVLIFGHWWIMADPFEPVADQEQVWKAAADIAGGSGAVHTNLIYFQEYPQQKPMAVIMSVAARVFTADLIAYEHMNLIFIAAAILMMALCVGEVSGCAEAGALTSLLLTSFVPLTLYSKFIYGSVPAIFFTVLAAYGLIKFFKGGSTAWLCLPAVSVPLAVMLYQSELIFLIAAIIVTVLGTVVSRCNRRDILACLITAGAIVILTMAMTKGTEKVFESSLGIAEEGGTGIPPSGHMLMGLMAVDDNMPGNYNGESQRIYEKLGYDTKAADEESRKKIVEALNAFIRGERSVKFFLVKTECQWLDPWFGGMTMNVYDAEYRGSYADEGWDAFLYGNVPKGMQGYLRILMIVIYGGALCCIIGRLKRGDVPNPIIYLPVIYFIGGFVFQFFWEQKSRYCLPYYLALFPLAAYGVYSASCKGEQIVSSCNRRKLIYVLIAGSGSLGLLMAMSLSLSHDFRPAVSFDEGTGVYRTKDMQLPKGDYGIVVHYESSEDIILQLYLDKGGTAYPVEVSGEETVLEIPAYMDSYKDHVHFEIDPSAVSALTMTKIHVYSPKAIYLDRLYMAFLFPLAVLLFYLLFDLYPAGSDDPKERHLVTALMLLYILIVPVSMAAGCFVHIPTICSRLRVSASFSVFLILLAVCLFLTFFAYGNRLRASRVAARNE